MILIINQRTVRRELGCLDGSDEYGAGTLNFLQVDFFLSRYSVSYFSGPAEDRVERQDIKRSCRYRLLFSCIGAVFSDPEGLL